MGLLDSARFLQSCFTWESPGKSIAAFLAYLLIVWNFELYMLPLSLCLLLGANYFVGALSLSTLGVRSNELAKVTRKSSAEEEEEEQAYAAESAEGDKEDKKSFMDQYQYLKEIGLQIQEQLDKVACIGERIKNTFNWTVGFQSSLAFVVLLIVALVLYFVPLRAILLVYGCHKVCGGGFYCCFCCFNALLVIVVSKNAKASFTVLEGERLPLGMGTGARKPFTRCFYDSSWFIKA